MRDGEQDDRKALDDDAGPWRRIIQHFRDIIGNTRYGRSRSPDFDPANRPSGLGGYWSAPYGRLLTYTLARLPPFEQPLTTMLEEVPRPLQEALDPVPSDGEPRDRNNVRLPWSWARSLTFDLFGPAGFVIGVVSAGFALALIFLPLLHLPPLAPEPKPTAPTVQGPEQRAPASPQAPAPKPPSRK